MKKKPCVFGNPEDFLYDLVVVCRAHGLSLSHEDHQGAFVVEPYCEVNVEWLLAADTHKVSVSGEATSPKGTHSAPAGLQRKLPLPQVVCDTCGATCVWVKKLSLAGSSTWLECTGCGKVWKA